MGTQLLFYETAVPVNSERHREWSIKKGADYSFTKHVNAVPLTAVEFGKAAAEYAIVFTKAGESVMPAVILGVQQKQNLYLNPDGSWQAKYVPAFIRRYPFVFSRTNNAKTFTLCLDEAFTGCHQDGLGERLFDAEGTRTEYLSNVLNFQKEYQGQFQITENFCKKLTELDLLEPMRAQLTLQSGQQIGLAGFMAINRDRLKKLDGDKLAELVKTNELELMYIHLQSMGHLSLLGERLASTMNDGTLTEQGEEQAEDQVAPANVDATDNASEKDKKTTAEE